MNFKSIDDPREVCKLDSKTIEDSLRKAQELDGRMTPLRVQFEKASHCVNTIRESFNDAKFHLDNAGSFINNAKREFDEVVKSAGESFAKVDEEFHDIDVSKEALNEFKQIYTTICGSTVKE